MSDFVNKVKKGSTEYDIRDARVPHPSAEDSGKAIKVNAQGEFELGNDIAKDGRIPDPQEADKGKFLHVNESDGSLEYAEAGGGERTYQEIDITNAERKSTIADLVGAISLPFSGYAELKYTKSAPWSSEELWNTTLKGYFKISSAGVDTYAVDFMVTELDVVANGAFTNMRIGKVSKNLESSDFAEKITDGYQTIDAGPNNFLPSVQGDPSKTYVLKSVSGTLTWVEETAGE